MKKYLTIVAKIEAKRDKIEFVKAELLKLIEPTRKEVGCVQYDLHLDNENPALFIFIENWESEEVLQDHANSEHFKAFTKATDGALENFIVNKMTIL